jgi:hypothetical protein
MSSSTGARCTECGHPERHWAHADENRHGHFFVTGASVLVGRDDLARLTLKKKPPREGGAIDHKFWIRSYCRQQIVMRDLSEAIRRHETAIDVLPEHELEVRRAIVRQLEAITERRKRIRLELCRESGAQCGSGD